MNARLKELLSNTFIFTIASFSSKILVFLMVPLYTSVLSTDDYGISDMIHTVVGLMLPILSLCIYHAVLRFCFLDEYEKDDIYSIGHRFIIIGFFICVLVTAGLYFFNLLPDLGLYIWFVPAQFILQSYSLLLTYFSRGIGEVKISAVAGIVSTVTIVILNLVFLLLLKWGIIGYLISFLAGSIVSIIIMWIKLSVNRFINFNINNSLQNQMVKFSAPLIPNDLSWWALNSFNRFFILSTLGISYVGIYAASSIIPSVLTVLGGIFMQAWMLSALNGYGTEENAKFVRKIHNNLFSILMVVTAVFILASKPLAILLLSNDFSSYWYMIPYLMVSVFMGNMISFYGSIFSAERKNTMQFISTLVGSILSVLIIVFMLKKYGVIIAAISNMIGYIIIWIIRKEGIKKYFNIGKKTLWCILQLCLLIGESVAVHHSIWGLAIVLFIVIIINNAKEILYSVEYAKTLAVEFYNKRNMNLK